MQRSFSQKITTAINGLFYLSESEAPVTLLQWPDACNLLLAQQKIAALTGTQPEDQHLQTPEAFLKPILQMAVPEDEVMQAYAKRWKNVFRNMQSALHEVQIIRCPARDAQQPIYIVGFHDDGATVLHTSATTT